MAPETEKTLFLLRAVFDHMTFLIAKEANIVLAFGKMMSCFTT